MVENFGGKTWLTLSEAAAFSRDFLRANRNPDAKGYSFHSLRKLARDAVKGVNRKVRARRIGNDVFGDLFIEQSSLENFLLHEAIPHGAHAEHDRVINGKTVHITTRK